MSSNKLDFLGQLLKTIMGPTPPRDIGAKYMAEIDSGDYPMDKINAMLTEDVNRYGLDIDVSTIPDDVKKMCAKLLLPNIEEAIQHMDGLKFHIKMAEKALLQAQTRLIAVLPEGEERDEVVRMHEMVKASITKRNAHAEVDDLEKGDADAVEDDKVKQMVDDLIQQASAVNPDIVETKKASGDGQV